MTTDSLQRARAHIIAATALETVAILGCWAIIILALEVFA